MFTLRQRERESVLAFLDCFIVFYILNSSDSDQRIIFELLFEFAFLSECEKPITTTEIYEGLWCVYIPTAVAGRLQWISTGWH